MQSNMKWNKHITELKVKLKKRIAGLYNVKKCMSQHLLKTISFGWFSSVLVYCLPLFGGTDKGDISDLQILQNKVARIVTGSSIMSNREDMYDNLGWMTVQQLIQYHTLLTVFRIRKSAEPEYLALYLQRENRNGNVIPPFSNMTLYRRSFVYRGILNWNNLPRSIRFIESLPIFKKEVKLWIMQNVSRFS